MFAAASQQENIDYLGMINENPTEVAATKGKLVVYPAPNEVQLDLDSDQSINEFWQRIRMVERHLDVEYPVKVSPSSTSGHWHVTVTLPHKLTQWQRLAWQSLLGSDSNRELLNLIRLVAFDDSKSCFFEVKP